ncbi:MAG: hypothetical protein JO180_01700 [Gemmatirosa sp.]|nr:hypothetical protein [Gemmatirosa sp.]
MRTAAVIGGLGVALLLFAAWGTRTAAGRRAFDEMAGMIPLGAGLLGALLVVAAAGAWLVHRWRAG